MTRFDRDGPLNTAAMWERGTIAGETDGTVEQMMLKVWGAGEGLRKLGRGYATEEEGFDEMH